MVPNLICDAFSHVESLYISEYKILPSHSLLFNSIKHRFGFDSITVDPANVSALVLSETYLEKLFS